MDRTNLEDDLKLCEGMRVNLGKAFDKLHSQASELLVFTHQWRDFEDYLKSLQGQVEKRFMELESREAELQNRRFVIDTIGELEVKADGLRREIDNKEEVLKILVEECRVKQRSKASQLDEVMESLRKTQAELGGQLAQMESDLERHRVEITAEMEQLGRAQSIRRELDEENERKTRDLTLVQEKVVECGKLLETRTLELTKTQGELGLKVEQLGHVKIEFTTEMEHLERIQTRNRELEEVIERKRKDLAAVLDKTAGREKQLEVVEDQLASQQKLLETRSLELVSKEKKLQELSLDLDLKEEMVKSLDNEMKETCQKIESKSKELEDIKLLIEDLTEELSSKEKRHREMQEAIHKLSCKHSKEERYIAEHESAKKEFKSLKTILTERNKQVEEGEKQIKDLSNSSKELNRQLKARREQFRSRQMSITDLTAEQDSVKKKLMSVKHEFRQCRQNLCNKEKELKSVESILTERNKVQAEEGEKKIQYLTNSIEELTRKFKVRQEQVCSIKKAIRECTGELEAKRKERDQVQSSITDLTVELKSKECNFSSVKKKIQASLGDLETVEEYTARLKTSLMEQEQGLEVREKELNEKEQKLKATEQELAKWVKDYEVKAKQLSSLCKERNMDQRVALTHVDVHKPTWNSSRKRGRYDDDESSSQSLGMETHGKENSYKFQHLRSPDKFKIDQIWAIYSNNDKGMPRKYAQIKRIETNPEFKLHVAPLELYRPPPNLTTHPVSCGRFQLKTGIAKILGPSSFSHEVKALKSNNANRFEVYPRKGEIWALYKNWNIVPECADDVTEEEDLEIVEVVDTKEQSIQAMLLTAKVFSKVLYGMCLESKAGFVDIPKKEVNRFSHRIPAVRRERSATRTGDCQWWELDSKAVLDLSPKKHQGIVTEHLNIKGGFKGDSSQMNWKKKWYQS